MSAALDLLSAIGSLASIASLTQQNIAMMSGPRYRSDDFGRQEPPIFAMVRPDQIVRTSRAYGLGEARQSIGKIDLSGINDDAIQALIRRLVAAEQRSAEKLEGPSYNLAELQEFVDELKAEVCTVLRMIKQLNGGRLPGQPLYDKWTRFQCG